ncbi:hypothetical protein HDK64DRAFT_126466 [Phyllosticta capitalensis]
MFNLLQWLMRHLAMLLSSSTLFALPPALLAGQCRRGREAGPGPGSGSGWTAGQSSPVQRRPTGNLSNYYSKPRPVVTFLWTVLPAYHSPRLAVCLASRISACLLPVCSCRCRCRCVPVSPRRVDGIEEEKRKRGTEERRGKYGNIDDDHNIEV